MKRRDFLRNSGWFVVGASLAGIPGCSDNTKPPGQQTGGGPQPAGTYGFPQGVASGDPQSDSVVLWTRIVINAQANDVFGSIIFRVQVASDASFSTIIVDDPISAGVSSDHTVRIQITGLNPATDYFYRFIADNDSISGRTRTAPDSAADVQINFAWVSCQDYSAGSYGAYRQMLIDDDARADADKIHAILHLGDIIYETRADGFQSAIDDNFAPIMLKNRDGSDRAVPAFPTGGTIDTTINFAATVDDYRSLYKTFLSDPDMQAVRARWPMIAVWDDHEFTDDCWQSQANYDNAKTLDEPSQKRRLAASQAWFEYVPSLLTGAGGVAKVDPEASDFAAPADPVMDADFTAPDADNFVDEPSNAAAVGAITIYRSLRFGKHVELVMTDLRSYRSDHAIPEELTHNAAFFAPRNVLPMPLVNTFDQGATANNNAPPETVLGFPNPRVASPVGTMLGKAQKDWWKATMKGSDATWKLWGNEVTMMRLRVQKLGNTDISDRVVSGDSWDGYPSERNELMGFLKDQKIANVVVLSGDIHASFAGILMDNYDLTTGTPTPVAVELVGSGISSNSLFSFFEFATRPPVPAALRALTTVDAQGGPKFIENVNLLLLQGTTSAGTFAGALAQGASVQVALGAALANGTADPNTNPHLKYADSNAQGYGYVKVTAAQVESTIVTINRPVMAPSDAGPGIKRTASFTIPAGNPGGMTGPVFTGTKPFPIT